MSAALPLQREKKGKLIRWILLILWLVLAGYGLAEHVFWRDEVRALSIAKAAEGLVGLPDVLQNEGHPILWYILLKLGYFITQSNSILPALGLIFALYNVFLLLFRSPFHWSLTALIIFGHYALYEYSIVSRNYGIAASFFLSFALTAQSKKTFLPLFMLALAAQCNFYASILAPLLGNAFLFDRFKTSPKGILLASYALLLSSAILAVITCLPTADSLVVRPFELSEANYLDIWNCGWGFPHLFDGMWNLGPGLITLILVLCLLLFIRQPFVLPFVYASMVFMAFFQLNIRPNDSHHEGVWLFAFIAFFWWKYKDLTSAGVRWQTIATYTGLIAFAFILGQNLVRGIDTYALYTRLDRSNADHLGAYLRQHPDEKRVLIAEPDYATEALPYYYPKPFYLPRENKFATYARFTRANQAHLSLNRLMFLYDSFEKIGFHPLIATQWDLETLSDTLSFSYGKTFQTDSIQKLIFKHNFEKVADFHEFISTDESYYLYRKKRTL